eukprot:CAMPEP_0184696864 /NCGR_PEP_ID=MMETSP0313-20130426/4022_1 /TAXON_ID=2792 /ORGANISM="Porphyridium aerugineum, Strain SAG 1380-2" /LENGTH=1055 /DNA_ID=CAMNT_0027155581 /DNA_START=107 /DNA_END=3274 /DNA_ORIENTATION=+
MTEFVEQINNDRIRVAEVDVDVDVNVDVDVEVEWVTDCEYKDMQGSKDHKDHRGNNDKVRANMKDAKDPKDENRKEGKDHKDHRGKDEVEELGQNLQVDPDHKKTPKDHKDHRSVVDEAGMDKLVQAKDHKDHRAESGSGSGSDKASSSQRPHSGNRDTKRSLDDNDEQLESDDTAKCPSDQDNDSDKDDVSIQSVESLEIPISGFEGPEKKLEIDFSPKTRCIADMDKSNDHSSLTEEDKDKGFRYFPRSVWDLVLKDAQCTILSVRSNEHFDAYLLSESSLFVYSNKIMIKTCGTTTLLRAVPHLLKMADQVDLTVEFVQYSRASFRYPGQQLFPHTSFQDEIEYLDQYFEGSSYVLGTNDGATEWHLYVADSMTQPSNQQSFEVFMFNLDKDVMTKFFNAPDMLGSEPSLRTTELTGISTLVGAECIVDAFNFDPCGYSMNGLDGKSYFTIHITPESHCSYVSFETNSVDTKDFTNLLSRVVSVFRPGKFSVAFVADAGAPAGHKGLNVSPMDWDAPELFEQHGGAYFHVGEPTFLRMGQGESEYCARLCSYVRRDLLGAQEPIFPRLLSMRSSDRLVDSKGLIPPKEVLKDMASELKVLKVHGATSPSESIHELLRISEASYRDHGIIERPIYLCCLTLPHQRVYNLQALLDEHCANSVQLQHDIGDGSTDGAIVQMFGLMGMHFEAAARDQVDFLLGLGIENSRILRLGSAEIFGPVEAIAVEAGTESPRTSSSFISRNLPHYLLLDSAKDDEIRNLPKGSRVSIGITDVSLPQADLVFKLHQFIGALLQHGLVPAALSLETTIPCPDVSSLRNAVRALHWTIASLSMKSCVCTKVHYGMGECALADKAQTIKINRIHLGQVMMMNGVNLDLPKERELWVKDLASVLDDYFMAESGIEFTLNLADYLAEGSHFLAVPVTARQEAHHTYHHVPTRSNKGKSLPASALANLRPKAEPKVLYFLDSEVNSYLHVLKDDMAVETLSISSMSSDNENLDGPELFGSVLYQDGSGKDPVWSGKLPALEVNDCVVFKNVRGMMPGGSFGARYFVTEA